MLDEIRSICESYLNGELHHTEMQRNILLKLMKDNIPEKDWIEFAQQITSPDA